MILEPTYIPCITTSKQYNNDIHLISVSPNKPLVKAKKRTLVDCRTYGLILNRNRIDPVKHYFWYTDFVNEIQNEKDLYFIAPDSDWCGKEIEEKSV